MCCSGMRMVWRSVLPASCARRHARPTASILRRPKTRPSRESPARSGTPRSTTLTGLEIETPYLRHVEEEPAEEDPGGVTETEVADDQCQQITAAQDGRPGDDHRSGTVVITGSLG